MPLSLPKLDSRIAVVRSDFTPSMTFHQWWDRVVKSLSDTFTQLEATIADVQTALTTAISANTLAGTAQSGVDALDDRVTILENSSSGTPPQLFHAGW